MSPALSRDLIARLPKTDLHVHLDGSLRPATLIELSRERRVRLPSRTEEGLRALVFKQSYRSLTEYLRGFAYTVACLADEEALERAAYELCEDSQREGVRYLEVRFAPQLHVGGRFGIRAVLRAVARGLARARREFNRRPEVAALREPRFECGIIVCAMRFFSARFSEHFAAYFRALPSFPRERVFALASVELARSTVAAIDDDGVPVVGFDLAGAERGFPAQDHREAYELVHERFLGKTVHAGEDYGPESIFQALTDLHADRLGHGTWLMSPGKIRDPRIRDRRGYVADLVRYVADRRITLEVCLTSNQQTMPELRRNLSRHPFGRFWRERISTTLCTDNRLVSRTTVTDEIMKAVRAFRLGPRELKDLLVCGFKRSFFPGPYSEKRRYVRSAIDYCEETMARAGFDVRGA